MDKENKSILISIIMPCYNCEEYLTNSIASVLSQTYEEIELIIIDDCSTDNSVKIIERLIRNNEKLHLIKLNEHKGVSNARNTGIKASNGEFILFLDADDIITDNFVESLVKVEENNTLVRAFNFKKENNYKKEKYLEKIAYGEVLGTCCGYLIDKKKCSEIKFNTNLSFMEDTNYIIKVINMYENVAETCEAKYIYICNNNSSTRKIINANSMLNNYYYSIDLICEELTDYDIDIDYKKIFNRKFLILNNILKQVNHKEINNILKYRENKKVLYEKKSLISKLYQTFIGRIYLKLRSFIKYNIFKL